MTNWQRRQNSNNNFSAVVPYDLEQQRKETREVLDDLTTRDQRMMFAVVTLVHLADSKEELDSDTDAIQSATRKHLCQLATLNWQQADGLVTALPIEGLGGEVINISATSPNHINAMDMEQGYGDGENPVVLKSEFLLSLCEQLMGDRMLSAKEKSIIDRCTASVYHSYIKGGYQGKAPTLQDFHAELLR